MRAGQARFSQDWRKVFESLLDRARTEYEADNRERSLDIWRRAYAQFPDLCMSSVPALHLILDLGGFDEAEEMMRQARARYPRHAPFTARHALVARRRGDLEEALRRCTFVRKKFPREAGGYAIAGHCLVELGRELEAEEMFALGARRVPGDLEINVRLAQFAEQRRDWSEAMRRWRIVRDRCGNWHGFVGMAGCLRELGRHAEAGVVLVEAADKFPEEPWPVYALANLSRAGGKSDEAARYLADLHRRFPYFPQGYAYGAEIARGWREM